MDSPLFFTSVGKNTAAANFQALQPKALSKHEDSTAWGKKKAVPTQGNRAIGENGVLQEKKNKAK